MLRIRSSFLFNSSPNVVNNDLTFVIPDNFISVTIFEPATAILCWFAPTMLYCEPSGPADALIDAINIG